MEDTREIERKVFAFIEKHRLLTPGDGVVVGVSGGADSVCLLFVLEEWAKRFGLRLWVVHVNHGIRPEAGEDAAYVERLCDRLRLPFTLVERDVREEALRNGCSEEETGRLIRYEAFEKVAREFGAARIAVAHNANDQAETMLFHLFRGAGLSGLSGIRPKRNKIIRPLLCLERREIETYLERKGVAYCRDVTNESDDYTRNRIRHHILPYAEEEVAGRSVAHMSRTAEMLRELEEYLDQQVEEIYGQVVRETGAGIREEGFEVKWRERPVFRLDRQAYRSLPPALGKHLLLRLLKELGPFGKDIGYLHVEGICVLAAKTGNGRLDLPYGIHALGQYEELILYGSDPVSDVPWNAASVAPASLKGEECEVTLPDGKSLCFSVFPYEKNKNIPKNEYTKWFDCDKMKGPLLVRMRESGDFLSIRGKDGRLAHQSLKQYMMNEKIPRQERDRKILVAEGSHVVWAVGYRISEYYKVTEDTRTILQIRLRADDGAETAGRAMRDGRI